MFCNIFFRPINHLPAGKGVANARRKQSNSAQPFSWALRLAAKQPQITESNLGLFLLRGGSNSKMVAPHLMCSRIFFR